LSQRIAILTENMLVDDIAEIPIRLEVNKHIFNIAFADSSKAN